MEENTITQEFSLPNKDYAPWKELSRLYFSFASDMAGTWSKLNSASISIKQVYRNYLFAPSITCALISALAFYIFQSQDLSRAINLFTFVAFGNLLFPLAAALSLQILAPQFQGSSERSAAFLCCAFSFLPLFFVSIFGSLPNYFIFALLFVLLALGTLCFSLMLLWTGLSVVMQIEKEKQLDCFLALLIVISLTCALIFVAFTLPSW